jgi:hypothetical protein
MEEVREEPEPEKGLVTCVEGGVRITDGQVGGVTLHAGYFCDGRKELKKVLAEHSVYCSKCYLMVERGSSFWCGGCRCVAYCSTECRASDWTGEGGGTPHKRVCEYLGTLAPADRPGAVGKDLGFLFINERVGRGLFALRAFRKGVTVVLTRPAKRSAEEVEAEVKLGKLLAGAQEAREKYDAEVEAGGDVGGPPPEANPKKAAALAGLSVGQKLAPGMFDEKVMILSALQTQLHRVEITSIPNAVPGDAFYLSLELGMVNHSCDPNCYLYYDSTFFYLIALRDLEEGEQLTMRYGDPAATMAKKATKEAYEEELLGRHGISCPSECECKTPEFWGACERVYDAGGGLRSVLAGIAEWSADPTNHGRDYPTEIGLKRCASQARVAVQSWEKVKQAVERSKGVVPPNVLAYTAVLVRQIARKLRIHPGTLKGLEEWKRGALTLVPQ